MRALTDIGLDDLGTAGAKAARLGHLLRLGFNVPAGFVVSGAGNGLREGLAALGPGPVAVRSSGTQEDLGNASFAGLYETFLNIEGEAEVAGAIQRCLASGESDRVRAYGRAREAGPEGSMAVLVQRMVAADAAGVAYTANPLSGDRDEVVISAVRGLGERLVGGESSPDEWSVRAGVATCNADREHALGEAQALEIAALARRVEDALSEPQDIEWAIKGDDLYLLQSRPIAGLPEQVTWECADPRGFARNFRFGEWLGDPVTPLCESWLLTRMEQALHDEYFRMMGMSMPEPYHVVINGWYFYLLPNPPDNPRDAIRILPGMLRRLVTQPRKMAMAIPPLAHLGIEQAIVDWREDYLPRYQRRVREASSRVPSASREELIDIVDALACEAGRYFTTVTLVAGFSAKAEHPLATFYKEHLHPQIGGSHLDLLQGLVPDEGIPPHSVQSLDWYFPTAGELGITAPKRDTSMKASRLASEARAREALRGSPKLARRFDKLLATAQRFQPLREECVSHLTEAWPVMRAALDRLGSEDIHFLTLAELMDGASPPVAERRGAWERQRRLSPPLLIGRVHPMAGRLLRAFSESTRMPSSATGLTGVAASPGRVSGSARLIRDASEFHLLQPGEVLVARATTPAWTPLFSRAAAVVTDTGSIGSHASQVAREYGIPAVVCVEGATRILRSGRMVTVDGNAGVVSLS